MSKRDAGVLLEDIRDAMRKVSNYIQGMDLATFMADEKTADAVIRNIGVIGEAAKQLPEDFKTAYPQIPWHLMAGMRNRLVHDYAGVDLEIVWQVAGGALPAMAAEIARIEAN